MKMKRILSALLVFMMLISVLPVAANAAAPGTMMSNAVQITFGQSYYKTWTKDTDHLNHYSTFTLTKSGVVTLKVDKPFDSEGEYSKLDITFFDEEGEPIMGSESYYTVDSAKSYYTVKCGLAAGTYYMTLKPGFYVRSGVIETTYTLNFEANKYCEQEPNGDASTATEMVLGAMYTGFFGPDGCDYEENDYYKFQAQKGHVYRIRMENFGALDRTTTILSLMNGSETKSLGRELGRHVDEEGLHYYDFTAASTGAYYIRFRNFNGAQYEFGLEVQDLTDPQDPDDNNENLKVTRLAGAHRCTTSLMVADAMKQNLGVSKFNAIIIASGNDFADALAGSYLSTTKNAPIVLAWGKGGNYAYLDENNITYIKANLATGGTVYILGGTNAVPDLYENALSGYNVKRLGGANRFETNLLILEEAGVPAGSEVLVCTSTNFADSLSASATKKPILLVFNESGKLYGRQPEFLSGLSGCTFTVIGGESAVGNGLQRSISAYGKTTRLAGANRFETSVQVAQKYFGTPKNVVLAYAWNYPDGLCGGSLAYSLNAPLILTMTKYETQAAGYVQGKGIENGMVLGGTGLISDDSVRKIFKMSPNRTITEKDQFTLPEVEDTPAQTEGNFQFYDYESNTYVVSNFSTYQAVTGVPCKLSSFDWGFTEDDYTNAVNGYDEEYGIFLYDYDSTSMAKYIAYLESQGFVLYGSKDFQEGTSYYYYHAGQGFYVDMFVSNAYDYLAIEPFTGATPDL